MASGRAGQGRLSTIRPLRANPWTTRAPGALPDASGRLLGAQMAGAEGVAKRIDVLATALHARMTVEQVAGLDLSYAPPFSTVWDPVLIAAQEMLRELRRS